MNRSIRSIVATVALAAVPFTAILGHASTASALEVIIPEAYVASYEPIYYNGFAHYYYHGHWFYRDHGAWRGYDHEPAALISRRGEWANHWHRWR